MNTMTAYYALARLNDDDIYNLRCNPPRITRHTMHVAGERACCKLEYNPTDIGFNNQPSVSEMILADMLNEMMDASKCLCDLMVADIVKATENLGGPIK